MLVRTLLLAVPLVLMGAGNEPQSSDSSSSSSQATREKDDKTSLPGPSGAKDQGGAGANTGTAGAREETAAGEKGDTTSGAKSGRWDESGGKTPREGAASAGPPGAPDEARPPSGHAGDSTVAGKLSQVSGGSITIQTGPGTSQTLKLVPQTKITSGGKDADHTELKEGQQVRASFMEHGGEQVAVTVHAASAASDEPTGEKTHNPRNNPQADQKK
jgi:hypothetical protein